jgi:hypothetical protein
MGTLDDVLKRFSVCQRSRLIKGHQVAVDPEEHLAFLGNGASAACIVAETAKF